MIRSDGDGFQIVWRLEGVLGVCLSGVELGPAGNQQFDLGVEAKASGATSLESKKRFFRLNKNFLKFASSNSPQMYDVTQMLHLFDGAHLFGVLLADVLIDG